MKIKHIKLLILKPLFFCFVLLQAVSCWDGLNDMLEEGGSPSAITFIQSSLTSGGMTINWTDPASVTGYDHILVTYTSGSSVTLSKGVTSFSVSGLVSSTEYTVTVQAIGKEDIIKAQSSFKVTPSGTFTLRFIYTAADLDSVRSNLGVDDYYVVMNDIDLSGYANWDPIGTFSGILDCQNYRLSNMTINRNEGLLGLFERVDGIVKNCIISGSITGATPSSYMGGIAGEILTAGKIINCCSTVSITAAGTGSRLGGIAGNILGTGEIRNCSAKGDITSTGGTSFPGGLVGFCSASTNVVINCYATGKVVAIGDQSSVGGLTGRNLGTIKNSYSTGSVSGTNQVGVETGGLVGLNDSTAEIDNCYAVGYVTGGVEVGGLVGSNAGVTPTACYYDSQTTGQSDTGKGDPRTTNQMKLIDTSVTTYSGWDFTTVWGISSGINGGYPYLRSVAP
jgi:hypothetical protein